MRRSAEVYPYRKPISSSKRNAWPQGKAGSIRKTFPVFGKPGPNSLVGVVWIALSKPHYGIHGTSSPDTFGYASSHCCVRLTNCPSRTDAAVSAPMM